MGAVYWCCHWDDFQKEKRNCFSSLGKLCSSEIQVLLLVSFRVQISLIAHFYYFVIWICSYVKFCVFKRAYILGLDTCTSVPVAIWKFKIMNILQFVMIDRHRDVLHHALCGGLVGFVVIMLCVCLSVYNYIYEFEQLDSNYTDNPSHNVREKVLGVGYAVGLYLG